MSTTTTRAERRGDEGDVTATAAPAAPRPKAPSARRASPTFMSRLNRRGVLVFLLGLAALLAVVAIRFVAPAPVPDASLTLTPSTLSGAGVPEGATAVTTSVSGQTLSLIVPGASPIGMAVYFHEEGGDAATAAQTGWIAPLVAAGWAVASADLHGDSWGSPASTSDLRTLVTWAQEQTGLAPELLVSNGMGALVSLNAMTRGAISARCWYGVESVTDLGSYAADPTFAQRVGAAYREQPGEKDNPVENAETLATQASTFRLVGADALAGFTEANSGMLAQGLTDAGASVTVAAIPDAAGIANDLTTLSASCSQ